MYLKRNRRLKDGKEHVYWNIVESKRCAGGKIVQRQVLYLGEINDGQLQSWSRVIKAFDEGTQRSTQLALFPADRAVPQHAQSYGVAVRLDAMELHRPRQWGACWLAVALVHHAFGSPDQVESWAASWGEKLQAPKLTGLKLQRGFMPLSETLSNQEYPNLWDLLFARHPKGQYYRGKFEQSGNLVPAKSLLQDMFAEQKTALILDELQTWYDGLHDEPGPEGKKRLRWAFNFIQTLSELAEDRPDLFCLIVSVRDNTTDAFQQIHRKGPVVIDFKGETAREDRKKLVLHRLFQNRATCLRLKSSRPFISMRAKE